MKIKINILYWDNGEVQRFNNTNLSWYYLNCFCRFANLNGLEIEPFLFDFSEEKTLGEDAIHISYPMGIYKRSEKINKVIEYHGQEEYIFAVMDSDLIIPREDYLGLVYLLKNLKNEKFYVFNLNDLTSLKGVDFENKKITFEELEYQQRQMEPDLGALFFINSNAFEKVGKFDERFIAWGGEDNRMSYDLVNGGYKKVILPIIPFHLPHRHALKESDKEQYQKQLTYLK